MDEVDKTSLNIRVLDIFLITFPVPFGDNCPPPSVLVLNALSEVSGTGASY